MRPARDRRIRALRRQRWRRRWRRQVRSRWPIRRIARLDRAGIAWVARWTYSGHALSRQLREVGRDDFVVRVKGKKQRRHVVTDLAERLGVDSAQLRKVERFEKNAMQAG